MGKTLDEILNRNDYVRLSESLKEQTKEIAKRIRRKMEDLDLINDDSFFNGEIGADGVTVCVKSRKSNAGSYEYLAIKRKGEYYGEAEWYSLEDVGKDYYFAGDFNAEIVGASNKEALAFLNVAKKLIEGLGEVEDKLVNNVQTALKNEPSGDC